MIHKIILLGPQGSGKGTQAELLAQRLGIPAFGMGQLCREEVASGSALGREIDQILLAGNLVSDQTAAALLKKRLAQPDTKKGYILDGYPRNAAQAAAFTFDRPTHLVVIEVPRDESLKRLSGRLTCRMCSKVFRSSQGHKAGDACPCEGELFQRTDDTPAAISRRLEIYEQDTKPVIAVYEQQGIVRHVDGMGSIEEVRERIFQALCR